MIEWAPLVHQRSVLTCLSSLSLSFLLCCAGIFLPRVVLTSDVQVFSATVNIEWDLCLIVNIHCFLVISMRESKFSFDNYIFYSVNSYLLYI